MEQITSRPLIMALAILLMLLLGPYFLGPETGFAQWQPDRRLTFNDSISRYPCVASNPSGFIHVAWEDTRGHYWRIYYKRTTDNGTNWSQDTTYNWEGFEAAITASGSLVHLIYIGGSWICYVRSTDNGATWSPQRIISDTSFLVDADYPQIAAVGSSVHVVWEDDRDGNNEIYYKRSIDNGITWSPDTRLTNDPNNSEYPNVAVSGSTVHIAWQDDRSRQYLDYYKHSTDNGVTWSPDTCFFSNNVWGIPSITVSGSVVYIVWDGVYYVRSTNSGSTWSTPAHISGGSDPSVTATGTNVHLVWRYGNDLLYKCSRDWGVTWTLDTSLTDTSAYATRPAIVTSGAAVHVVWQDDRIRYNYPEIYYKRNPTGNIGVEQETGQGSKVKGQGYTLTPNPFTTYTTFLGYKGERVEVYDIAGRKVGAYRGDRIGWNLAPGVYFIKPEQGSHKPLRIVKLK